MASNMAARRAAKANRRKAVLANKRRAELESGSLAGQVAVATNAPIRDCLISDGWSETGMATLVLTRGVTAGHVALAMFLLDTYCLGIKDVVFRHLDGDELATFLDMAEGSARLSPIDPTLARRLLRDLAAWATSNGFSPHRDFAAVERLFGTVSADSCTTKFEFGREGKPFYVAGPLDTPAQIRQRFAQVSKSIGGTGAFELIPLVAEFATGEVVEGEVLAEDPTGVSALSG